MLNPLFSLCVYLIEMVISYIFFSSLGKKKMDTKKTIVIGFLLFTFGSTLNVLFKNNGPINALMTLVVNIAFDCLCFDSTLLKSFFYAFILDILNIALEVTVITLSSFIISDNFRKLQVQVGHPHE